MANCDHCGAWIGRYDAGICDDCLTLLAIARLTGSNAPVVPRNEPKLLRQQGRKNWRMVGGKKGKGKK